VVSPAIDARFTRLSLDDLPALTIAMGEDSIEEIRSRFEAGKWCFGAWIANRLASFGWVSFEEEAVGELRLRLSLLTGEAYIWNCVTLPVFRNYHLYSALLAFIVGELFTIPYCRVWIGADQENEASQRGIARAGFTHVGGYDH